MDVARVILIVMSLAHDMTITVSDYTGRDACIEAADKADLGDKGGALCILARSDEVVYSRLKR